MNFNKGAEESWLVVEQIYDKSDVSTNQLKSIQSKFLDNRPTKNFIWGLS